MSKKFLVIMSVLLIAVFALSACAKPAETAKFKACMVTDTGGIDDKSFNATGWKGVTDAMAQFDIDGKYLESKEIADFEKNINAFIAEKCDIIITVGFLLGDVFIVFYFHFLTLQSVHRSIQLLELVKNWLPNSTLRRIPRLNPNSLSITCMGSWCAVTSESVKRPSNRFFIFGLSCRSITT